MPPLASRWATWIYSKTKETHTVGQIPGSAGGSGTRRINALCGRNLDHVEVRRTISTRYSHHQCHWRVSHRSTHDPPDREISPASQLASLSGCGNSWRIHYLLELRVRNLPGRARRRTLAGLVLYDRQCPARLSRRLVRHAAGSRPIGAIETPRRG